MSRRMVKGKRSQVAASARTRRAAAAPVCRCLLALLLGAAVSWGAPAQSGRKKPPADATRGAGEKRPRTVGAGPAVEPAATPSPAAGDGATTPAPPDSMPPSRGTAPARTAPRPSPPASTQPVALDDEEIVRIHSNLVPIPASIIDAQGRAVADLELKDFELLVDGVAKPIGEVSRAETPVRMAVLYDNSSSVRAGREFELHAAVNFFRTVLRPVDEAALYSVTDTPTLVQPLTNNVRALVRIVEHFPEPQGATSLFDAVAMAAEYLRPHQGRKVVVVISDGADTTSALDFDQTLRRLISADCQFYAVQTLRSESANLRDLGAERRLEEFAAQTGGAVYAPRAAADLDRAFAQLAADLSQQYVLSYYASEESRDGRFRTFTLRVPARPALRVRTRKGYYAPKG